MSGLTASNLLLYVVWGPSLAQGMLGKGQCSIDTNICNCKLADEEEPHPSNYEDCRNVKQVMRKRKSQRALKTITGRHTTPGLSFVVVLCSNTQQQ
jgi:hypothetical protein